jgi:hypothetical protein
MDLFDIGQELLTGFFEQSSEDSSSIKDEEYLQCLRDY